MKTTQLRIPLSKLREGDVCGKSVVLFVHHNRTTSGWLVSWLVPGDTIEDIRYSEDESQKMFTVNRPDTTMNAFMDLTDAAIVFGHALRDASEPLVRWIAGRGKRP